MIYALILSLLMPFWRIERPPIDAGYRHNCGKYIDCAKRARQGA